MSLQRKLSNEEIDDILQVLNLVPTILQLDDVRDMVLGTQQEVLKAQLSSVIIVPEAIPELKEYILKHYIAAQVDPGSTVGFRAAEALAQPATQIALNAFHFSGSNLNVTSGIGGIKEILEAKSTSSQKHRMCVVHFNKRLKLSDIVFHKQSQFMESSFYDFVISYDIISAADFWEPNTLPEWINVFQHFMGITIPGIDSIDWVMKIEMDTSRMYAMNITMIDLYDHIVRSDPSSMLHVWFSSMTIANPVVYIAANREMVVRSLSGMYGNLGDYLQLLNFDLEVIPMLKRPFKGIKDIKGIHPVEQSVLGIIVSETQVMDNLWLLQLSRLQIRVTGVTKQMLIDLITQSGTGLSIEPTDEPYLLLVRSSNGRKVSTTLITLRDEIENEARALIRDNKPIESFAYLDKNKFYNLFNYYYLETEGSNLRDILIRKDVNNDYTTSSNIHEITSTLGTEAVRNYITYTLYSMIKSNGMDIDPRHLILIGEVMISTGKLVGMNMSGAASLAPDHLTKTVIGQATNHLMHSAVFGSVNPIGTVTSALYVGKAPQIGTGMVKLKTDPNLAESLVKELEEGRVAEIRVDEFTSALNNITEEQGQPLFIANSKNLKVSSRAVGPVAIKSEQPSSEDTMVGRTFSLSLKAGMVNSFLLRDAAKSVKLPDPSVCDINRHRSQTIFPIKGLTSEILKTEASGYPSPGTNLLPSDISLELSLFPRSMIGEIYEALEQDQYPEIKYGKTVMGPPILDKTSIEITNTDINTTGQDIFSTLITEVDLMASWDI